MVNGNPIKTAVDHHRAGRLAEAEQIYRKILEADADNFDALHLLGVAAHQRGNNAKAVELIGRALVVNPSSPEAYRNCGEAYRAAGNLDRAQVCIEKALSLNPGDAEAYNSLGITLHSRDDLNGALAAFKRAVEYDEAFAAAQYNLAGALLETGQANEAIERYENALALNPGFAKAHLMLGRALERVGRRAEALAKYQEALQTDATLVEGHLHLGQMLYSQGLVTDAQECFEAAVKLDPEHVEARWVLAMSQLAPVAAGEELTEGNRRRFAEAIAALDQWFNKDRIARGFHAVGGQQPFFIAYQEQDNVELLSRYGDLCARLMGHWQASHEIVPASPNRGELIRVGIVSAQVRDHSVWNAIVKGWLLHVDRKRFSFHIFHTSDFRDEETSAAKEKSAYFREGPLMFREWADDIVGQQLDVLIYPEIGMDPLSLKLASMRLAPVQVVAWGHPETSGLPTLDYYLSAEDFEPEGAERNYRERLIALPHLGCCYEPLPAKFVDVDFDELGIDSRYPILVCAGAPFKYAARHDWMLVEIAKRLGKCQLVFFHHMRENLSSSVEERLEAAFEDRGLFFHSHGIFIPWLNRDAFYSLMRKADVFLDTIGFSGFNTVMQAIECSLPVVTMDGRFMRGRLGSGIMKRLRLPDLVAKAEGDYVELAVKLASDKQYSRQVRARIEANRQVLFNDEAPVRALEAFLVQAAR
jgi:protein O-GlcNAc transferase